MFFDPLYLIVILPAVIVSILAQMTVKGNYEKYRKIKNFSGKSGRDVALEILNKNGIFDVRVEETSGWLSDHYSPAEKKLRLSKEVFYSDSIASVGIAAHEAGHALQHYKGFSLMNLWMSLAKPASIAGNISVWLIFIGMMINMFGLAMLGFYTFLFVVFFQIITLPVEFDASNRAKKLLIKYGIVSNRDLDGVKSVLNSAGFTYIAAALVSISQVLYYAIKLGLFNRRDD